ncbi:UTP--glucose-1-phosphate uridylyltransferase [Dehalococcoidia bacterium]|nr:UTP--glucose-1-phosphate uridylyltransferase [Dehalococcoidia bacterium]
MTIRTAVIPVAGFGTRFLPATRSIPKVMIPVLDTPAIHLCVEEAVRSGIRRIVFVVSRNQEAIARYFQPSPELENALSIRGDSEMLDVMSSISNMIDATYIIQDDLRGLGHAVLMAKDEVDNEPFVVLLPDDVIWNDRETIGAMIDLHRDLANNIIAVKQVPDSMVPKLGIVSACPIAERQLRVTGMVEKPALTDAPSNLAIIGRYVLVPEIFEALENIKPGAIGEIQLTDAIATLIDDSGVCAYEFPGDHIDVGTPLGLLKASIHEALHREHLTGGFKDWLRGTLDSQGI